MAIKRITTNLIEDGSIGTIDIANNAIVAAKITDGNITTAKLADLNVTAGKLAGTLDLTGKTITVATATTGDSDTSPASTAFVQQEIAALVDSSPDSLNTLNELAAALGDDASFSTTVTNSIATKLPLAGGTMTGDLKVGATIASTGGTTNNRGMILSHQNNTNASFVGRSENGVADTGNRITFDYDNDKMTLDADGDITILPGSSNKVGIGTNDPAKLVHIVGSADNGLLEGIQIDNTDHASGETGQSVAINLRLSRAGTMRDAGRITIGKDDDWDNNAATDSHMTFKTMLSNTLTEHMRIDSSGNVGIGGAPHASGRLLVTNGGTNQIVLKGASGSTNLNMGNFVGGGYISNNYYYSSGHQADDNSKGAFEVFIGDENYGINYHAAGAAGTRRRDFAINSSGKVGIGTQSPDAKLRVEGDGTWIRHAGYGQLLDLGNWTDGLVRIESTGAPMYIRAAGSNYMAFDTNSVERMRIDSSGNVIIGGTEIPSTVLDGTGAAGALGIGNSSELYPAIALMSSQRNWLLYQNSLGNFQIYDSTSNDERFRLDTKGTMMTGGSFAHNTYAHAAVFSRNSTPLGTVVIEDSDVSSGIGNTVLTCYLRDQAPTSSASFIRFTDGGGTVGSVRHNADGSITFNDTSDYRLKENVDYDWNALTLLNELKPARFNFIKAPGKIKQGFLAHEVMDIVPGSVTGEKDHMEPIGTITDSEGNVMHEGVYEHFCKTDEGQTWTQTGEESIYQELDYSKLVPLLTKAMQEQQTLIESLTARITELEG